MESGDEVGKRGTGPGGSEVCGPVDEGTKPGAAPCFLFFWGEGGGGGGADPVELDELEEKTPRETAARAQNEARRGCPCDCQARWRCGRACS